MALGVATVAAVPRISLFAPVTISPLLNVITPFTVGVVATVTLFVALLSVRLLKVVAAVPPIAGAALVPVSVTVVVPWVNEPLLVQFPPAFPAPTLMAMPALGFRLLSV